MAKNNYISFVTGGTRGIGSEIVSVLRQRGDRVFTLSRRQSDSDDHISVDLSSQEQIIEVANKVGRRKIDNLVFCHRYRGDDGQQDLRVSFEAIHHVVETLKSRLSSRSSIVIIGSIASQTILDEQSFAYHGSRAALENLARYLSVRLGTSGTRCNCVMPTTLVKPENKEFFSRNNPVRQLIEEITPLNRMGTALDIAHLVEFLCSDKASYISGQSIVVDGGLSAVNQESIARRLAGLSHG